MSDCFDLIEFQEAIKGCADPKRLYEKSEALAKLFTARKIGKYEHDECIDSIKEQFAKLEEVKRQVS